LGAGRNQAAIATMTAISAMTTAMIVGTRDGPLDGAGPCGDQPDGAAGPDPYGDCDMHVMVSPVFAGALFTLPEAGPARLRITADQWRICDQTQPATGHLGPHGLHSRPHTVSSPRRNRGPTLT
jgi:hypothetical protein